MDLSVKLKGQGHDLVLKNPIMAASGTFGYGIEYKPYGDLTKLGGICVKSTSLKPRDGNPSPRIAETPAGILNSIGLQNDGIQAFLKRKLPLLPSKDTAIVVSLYATSPDEFAELAGFLDEVAGIAALEINVSCPNVKAGGAIFGSDPAICAEVVHAVRVNAPHKFLIVKLSPNVTDIASIAKSAEEAGTDCISCINTLLGMAVDIKSRRPMLANIVGGLSGPCIKPVALRCVWQVAKAVKIPVIGIGGIVTTDDILEFLLVGASAIQVGTANFMRPDKCFELVDKLPEALHSAKVQSPAELCGALLTD